VVTQFPDLFAALCAPFDDREVRSRSQAGRQMSYITARTAMNRLDSVLGPENWWDDYVPGENSVLCRLTIRLPDGSTLTKADAGGYAGMPDAGDDDKSGFSDGYKRAAVKFGVGRYLYRDGVPEFPREPSPDAAPPLPKEPAQPAPGPDRPSWGNGSARTDGPAGGNGHHNGNGNGLGGKAPTSGRALYGWCKEMEQRYEAGLIKYLNSWSKLQEFPGRMVDWSGHQVERGHAEAIRKLTALTNRGDAHDSEAYS
jgi:Rad52/22 family double-strand break repair protein